MMMVLIGAAVLGLVFVLVPATMALWIIRRHARPEAQGKVRRVIVIVLVIGVVMAAGWAPIQQRVQTSAADELLAHYCEGEKEEIYRTVSGVRGVHVRLPPRFGEQYYHEEDNQPEAYLRRPERQYDFVEYSRIGPAADVKRHERPDDVGATVVATTPQARYAFTWTSLTTIPEQNLGIYGDETVVFDLETGEVLARRIVYFHVGRFDKSRGLMGPEYRTCGKVDVGRSRKWVDHRQRDSYAFISRVLVPPELSAEENVAFSDLYRGLGQRRKFCLGRVHVGQTLSRDDVSLRRRGEDLVMSVDGTGDSLLCERFFQRGLAPSGEERVVFSDNGAITDRELENLPAEPELAWEERARIPAVNRRQSSRPSASETPGPDRYDQMVEEAVRRSTATAAQAAAAEENAGAGPDLRADLRRLPAGTRLYLIHGRLGPTTTVELSADAGPALVAILAERPASWHFRAVRPGQLKGIYFVGAGEQVVKNIPGGVPVYTEVSSGGVPLPEILQEVSARSAKGDRPPMVDVVVHEGESEVLLR